MWDFLSSLFAPQSKGPRPPMDTQLIGVKTMLRMGDPADWKSWRILREQSRDFLVPWEPSWPSNAMAYNYYCSLLRRNWSDWRHGKAYSFLIFRLDENHIPRELIGGIALNDIQRGIAQKGTLGYWMGEIHAGKGYMTEAAGLLCDFAFNSLGLHRIEASCLPHNERSKRLLKRLGFEEEGLARSYLQINGKWEDHTLWGRSSNRISHSRESGNPEDR